MEKQQFDQTHYKYMAKLVLPPDTAESITNTEIQEYTNQLTELLTTLPRKAPDLDQMPISILQATPDKTNTLLRNLYTLILKTRQYPTLAKTARTICIPKTANKSLDIDSCRLLSINNSLLLSTLITRSSFCS